VWEIEYTDEFERWWRDLPAEQQEEIAGRVSLLADQGPALRRPVVGTLRHSRRPNLKELRASRDGTLRIIFAFDPRRTAILLLGGDKRGEWNAWYATAIPEAERLYDTYLTELRQEGVI
jgi:hypothetical protein